MTPATPLAIALDVGGTKIAAATVDATGELVTPTSKVPTPAHAGAGAVLDALAEVPVVRARHRNNAALLGAARDVFRLAGVPTTSEER